MAIPIKHRRTGTPGAVPQQLEPGEFAVNYGDTPPSIYTGTATGAVERIYPPPATSVEPQNPVGGMYYWDNTLRRALFYDGGDFVAPSTPPNSIGTDEIAQAGVETDNLANRSVTGEKLALLAVDTPNFAANAVAPNARTLATPRAITLAGDVLGSATFDGSKNITINTVLEKPADATVVQSGSNSRGHYRIWSDGRSQQWNRIYVSKSISGSSTLADVIYPVPFTAIPSVLATMSYVSGTERSWTVHPYQETGSQCRILGMPALYSGWRRGWLSWFAEGTV